MKWPQKRVGAFLLAIALTSLWCVTLYFCDNKYKADGLQATDGLLVVAQGDLERQPVNYLVSGWALYPGTLLTPEDFAAGAPSRYMVYTSIGERTHFNSTVADTNPHGSASYFLRLALPETLETYALELPEIFSAYKLYIGGRLVLQMGNPDPAHYAARTQNRVVTFDAAGNTTVLLAVTDYSHFYSGMVYPPAFGTPLGLNSTRGLRLGATLFLSTFELLGAVLAFYFGLRMKHRNALLFSLLCFITCFYTSYALIHSVSLSIAPWYALELLAGALLPLLVLVLHNRLCTPGWRTERISTTIAAVFCLLALCYGLFSARLTVPVMRLYSVLLFGYKAAFAAYLFATSTLALKNRSVAAAPLYYMSIVYATVFVWDRILPSYEPIWGGWFPEWGAIALVFTIGYTLWRDITTAYAHSVAFAGEHRLMARQLAMQTEYARQLQQSGEENRRLSHDFRQHLHTVSGLAAQVVSSAETENRQRELLAYLGELAESTQPAREFRSGKFCESAAADALLHYYDCVAREIGVKTDFRLLLPGALPLSDVELCTVLGNLLENAVDACQRQPGGARSILLSTSRVGNMFLLLVENTYDGAYTKIGGRFRSRKIGREGVGIGLESVRNIVERHGGTLDIYPLAACFRVGITFPVR